MPFFSVIIPTFNRAQMAKEAVESALAQTERDFEIIVIDDGSSDNTEKLLAEFENKIKYFRKPNEGVAAARNTGVTLASGQFICYLDSDDLWPINKLEIFKSVIAGASDTDLVFSDFRKHHVSLPAPYELSNSDMFPFIYDLARKDFGQAWRLQGEKLLTLVLRGYPFYPSTIAIRREVHEQYRWDPGVLKSEDFNLILKLAGRYRFTYVDQSLATVRVHDSNKSADTSTKNHVILASMKLYRDLYAPKAQHALLNTYISRKQLSCGRSFLRKRSYLNMIKHILIAMTYKDTWRRALFKPIEAKRGRTNAR